MVQKYCQLGTLCLMLTTLNILKTGSGDGSLTHFFVEPLNDSIAYTSESSQLTNPNPIYKCHLKKWRQNNNRLI